jgi:hypothetical protein
MDTKLKSLPDLMLSDERRVSRPYVNVRATLLASTRRLGFLGLGLVAASGRVVDHVIVIVVVVRFGLSSQLELFKCRKFAAFSNCPIATRAKIQIYIPEA